MTHPRRVLYLGGARSGKSSAAERRIKDATTRRDTVLYVATSRQDPLDGEWAQRVQRHRDRRPDHWQTVETQDLASVLGSSRPHDWLLIDCLTLWLTHVMDDLDAWPEPGYDHLTRVEQAIRALAAEVDASSSRVVLVSNEVGAGLVPATAGQRAFRDMLGTLNAAVAAVSDEVNLVVAGCVLPVKQRLATVKEQST